MKLKKTICIVLVISVMGVLFSGCNNSAKKPKTNAYASIITTEVMEKKGHKKVVKKYQTDKSVAFENTDGTKTLYVYASPICFLDKKSNEWRVINTSLVENSDNYLIKDSDISLIFPKRFDDTQAIRVTKDLDLSFSFDNQFNLTGKKEICENFVGENKDAVVYENAVYNNAILSMFPTTVGANFELKLQDKVEVSTFDVWIKLNKDYAFLEKMSGGYISVLDNRLENGPNNVIGVLQPPIIKNALGEISVSSKMSIVEKNDIKGYKVRFDLDSNMLDKGSTVFWTVELRREKQSDNAIYSKRPDWQLSFLTNHALIGTSDDYGKGRLMTRFDFTKMFRLKSENVISAKYDTYLLSQTKPNLQYDAYYISGEWCAVFGNWKSNYKTGECASSTKADGNLLSWDITNAVKKWCVDQDRAGELEQFGLMLESSREAETDHGILLTHDNTVYRSRTVVELSKQCGCDYKI